jgi:hypothetical protein
VNESRWEHALHATKGLGDWRRDLTVLVAVAAVMFAGLRLFAPGSVGGNLLYALLVGVAVLVVLPLFELLWHYRKAPKTPLEGEIARMERAITELREEEPAPEEPARPEPDPAQVQEPDQEQERYRSLRERLLQARRPKEGPGPE